MVDKLTYTYPTFSNQPRFIDDEIQDTDLCLNDFKDNGSLSSLTSLTPNPEFAYDAMAIWSWMPTKYQHPRRQSCRIHPKRPHRQRASILLQ